MKRYERALECAHVRSEFWRKLACEVREAGPIRADRLFGMADGADYVVADFRHETDPSTLLEDLKNTLVNATDRSGREA